MASCIHETTNLIPAKCEIDTAAEIYNGGQNLKGLKKKKKDLHFKLAYVSYFEHVSPFQSIFLVYFFTQSPDTMLSVCEQPSQHRHIMQNDTQQQH